MPRCKDSLIPFVELFENEKINKNKLIDLYVIEKIPDLINDDLVKLKQILKILKIGVLEIIQI